MLDIFEIVACIEEKSLEANSYVFELRQREWVRVRDLKVLKDIDYKFLASREFERPTFTPPHKLPENSTYDRENADYEFLLKYLSSKESEKLDSVGLSASKERAQLEETICELNIQISELDSEKDSTNCLNSEFEEIIRDLRVESSNQHKINLKLENELLEKEEELRKLEAKKDSEFQSYKEEHEDSISESKKLSSKCESLIYQIRSLKFALKVEREKYDDLKEVISHVNSKNENETVKDKVIEQAFSYFIQGPIGDGVSGLEIDRLEKKIAFLEKEIIENEQVYTNKIERNITDFEDDKKNYVKRITDLEKRYQLKITDLANDKIELRNKINSLESDLENQYEKNDSLLQTLSSDQGVREVDDKNIYVKKVTDLEKRYQIKITDLTNDKRELKSKINSLESELQKQYEKSDALINTVSSDRGGNTGDELKYEELRNRYEKSIENYENMLAHKDEKIRNLSSGDIGKGNSGDKVEAYLKGEILRFKKLSEENEINSFKYKKISEDSVKEVSVLKAQVEKLAKQRMDLGKKVNSQVELINTLKDQNTRMSNQVEELTKTTGAYKDEYKKLFDKNNKAIEKIQNQSSKIHDLTSGKEDELVQSQKEVDDLVNQMLDYKSQLQKEQNKAKKLEEDLKEVKIKEDKIELSSSNEIVASSDDDELKRLIGDSYEVENDAIWYVEFDTGVKTGPHKFSVVYDMKESGKITKSTRVKKEGEGYKSCGDIFELATPVDTHGQGDDRRFFIKRNSVRVPYYDLVSFEMNGNEYKGYCTSISSGGIFIELTSIKENEYKVNSKGRVFFPRGAIENPFNCAAQIKNISTSRPKGIGLMFIDLPEKAQDDILNYVNTYLNQSKKSA